VRTLALKIVLTTTNPTVTYLRNLAETKNKFLVSLLNISNFY
jgi:hypothetical protein